MRPSIVVFALLAGALPACAGDDPKHVPESEALAEVRAVLKLALAEKPDPESDPAAYRLRPAAFSRATFGEAYAQLPAAKKKVLDDHAQKGMLGALHDAVRLLNFEADGEIPTLSCAGASGGGRLVSFRQGTHEFLYRVARAKAGGVEVVDIGEGESLVGATLGSAWAAALARKPDGTTKDEALLLFVSRLERNTQEKARQEKARREKAKDNLRVLIMHIVRESRSGGLPPYGGRSFVLSVIANGNLNAGAAEERALLFGPAVPASDRAEAAAYREVTKAALAEGRDWSKKGLTTHAGRRNDEAKYKISLPSQLFGTIILADLSFEDVVIAGYTDGEVKELTREDLGLGPDDPFTVGDGAKSELLKKLSLR